MRSLQTLAAGALLLFTVPVMAQDDYEEATFTGKKDKPVIADIEDDADAVTPVTQAEETVRPYSERVYEGARFLQMDVEFVNACHQAVELVYQRKYTEAKVAFEAAQERFPGSALGPIGKVLVYQALMLENLDFSYEKQYEYAANQARQQLMQALEVRGNDAWENFILGGVLGIDAIHTMRKGNYLMALNRAIEAMKSVNRAKKLAPEFPDLLLGDGLYNYWRTVITRSVKGLPDFTDNRMLGIEQLQKVQNEGIFLGPAATFALTYTWLEEGALKRATAASLRNYRAYPDNVINNLMLGRLYMYRRNYTEALKFFKKVLNVAPKNRRVHYFLTRMYLRQKRLSDAELHVNIYLSFKLTKHDRALALHQKCLIYYRRKDWDTAERLAQEAWSLSKLKRAKNRLNKIKNARAREAGQ
jgi:tetratricopeptide (TPR) repeat protein